MKDKLKKWIRPSGRWTDNIVIAALLSLVLMYGGGFVSLLLNKLISFRKVFGLVSDSEAVIEFMLQYVSFIGIWVLFVLMCGLFKRNRPILKQLAPNRNGNNLKGILTGLLFGFGINGFCVLMSVLMGDIHLYFNEFDPLIFFVFLLVVMIQSGAEEIVDRVYLYQKLRRRYKNPAIAIVGNAILFSLLHIFNPGITLMSVLDIIVIGVAFALFVYYYDSVWAAIMYHTAWNFTQSIVFGLPNSGIVSEYSLFKLEAASAQNGLFYDVLFGVEGSVGALLMEGSFLAAILVINRGKPEKNDVWKEMEAAALAEAADPSDPECN